MKFIDEWTMEFSGTLEQHELLLNYLEEVDGRVCRRGASDLHRRPMASDFS